MPANESLLHSFASLLGERALDDYGLANPEPSILSEFIADAVMLDKDSAEALAWGEPADLDSDELDRLSDVFSLHRDLLSCFLRPSSPEVVLHVIRQTSEFELEDSDCPLCQDLFEGASALTAKDDMETMLYLCMDILSHLTVDNIANFELESSSGVIPLANQLDLVVGSLPAEAQLRVLAYAYQELAETTSNQRAAGFAAYAELRSKYLSSLARQVLDLLAASESGSLSVRDIIHSLGLANGRALGQLSRSIDRSMERLRRAGIELPESPLTVTGRSRNSVYSLSDSARSSWRALIQAETTLEKQGS